MSIYMKIPGIEGDVTTKGYEKWIALESMYFNLKKRVNMQVGKMHERQNSLPRFDEIEVTKYLDKTSPQIFINTSTGAVIPQVNIDTCTTGAELKPYSQYTLHDVIISGYTEINEGMDHPLEIFTLSYSKVEKRITPYDAQHKMGSPIITGYDLAAAQRT